MSILLTELGNDGMTDYDGIFFLHFVMSRFVLYGVWAWYVLCMAFYTTKGDGGGEGLHGQVD